MTIKLGAAKAWRGHSAPASNNKHLEPIATLKLANAQSSSYLDFACSRAKVHVRQIPRGVKSVPKQLGIAIYL